MADNVELDAGTGGATIKTDDDGTAHWQYIKAAFGADNTQTIVTSSAGLPVKVVEGVTPGTGATDLGKAEDAAHSSGDTGIMALGVRNDTVAALAGADGDYAPIQVDAEGRVYVAINNNDLVSTNNSSAVVLAGDATFTGTGEDISNYAAVSVQVFSSHVSATDGLSMEFSTDNSNWDEKHLASVAATTSREFVFPTHAQYFRVVYTNGNTLQTSFRLQIILHVQSVPSTSHSLEESAHADDVGVLTKSVIIAQAAGTGDFVPVQATTGGNLKVSIEEADTSASGLAKAVDNVAGGTDTGVAALAIRDDSLTTLTPADGDYTNLRVSSTGALHVTGGGGGTEYTEDVATADPIVGTATLVERDDALSAVTPAEGDWIGLRGSAEGALWVQDFNSDAALTALQLIDDVVATDDTTTHATGTTKGVSIMAAATPTDGSVAANDIGSVAMSTDRRLHVDADVTASVALDVSAATVTVDGSGVTQPVSAAALPLPSGAAISANQSARASGGSAVYLNQDTSAAAEVTDNPASTIYWIHCVSTDATPVYLNLYDVDLDNVTLGTTTPTMQFVVPTQGDSNGAGFTINFGPHGVAFTTGFTVACATTFDGSTDPGTNVVITNIGYST